MSVRTQVSSGLILEKDFSVNLDAPYTIDIEAKKKIDFDVLNCLLGMNSADKKCETAEVIKSRWILAEDKQIVASGSSTDDHGGSWANDTISREIGRFNGKSGHSYHLEVTFLDDGNALSPADPRLIVGVDGDVYEGDAFRSAAILIVSTAFVVIGGFLFITAAVVKLRTSRDTYLKSS